MQNLSRNKGCLTSQWSLIFLLVWIWNFPTDYGWLKKIKAHLSDSEEGDEVQGSDKHNLQHAGDGVLTITWDNASSTQVQWGYGNFIEIVFTCELLSSFQQLSKSCLGKRLQVVWSCCRRPPEPSRPESLLHVADHMERCATPHLNETIRKKTWKLSFKSGFWVVATNFLNFLGPAGSS